MTLVVIAIILGILFLVYQLAITETPSSLTQPEKKSGLIEGLENFIDNSLKKTPGF